MFKPSFISRLITVTVCTLIQEYFFFNEKAHVCNVFIRLLDIECITVIKCFVGTVRSKFKKN